MTTPWEGSALPVTALREGMREYARLRASGGRLPEAYQGLYGWGEDALERQDRLQSLLDTYAPAESTLGAAYDAIGAHIDHKNIGLQRLERCMPTLVATTFCGGLLSLTGLGYALSTSGVWCTGGLIGGAVGLGLAAIGGLSLRAHFRREKEIEQMRSDARHIMHWGDALTEQGVKAQSTSPAAPPNPLDPREMSADEKRALLARLKIEIREAELKREARVEREGDVVAIGGVKLQVRK